jgi:hypothetical protein
VTALRELRDSGAAGRELEATLARLLRLKPKAQYQSASVTASDAGRAVSWADRMVARASSIVDG